MTLRARHLILSAVLGLAWVGLCVIAAYGFVVCCE
jgi:hypothetical protein